MDVRDLNSGTDACAASVYPLSHCMPTMLILKFHDMSKLMSSGMASEQNVRWRFFCLFVLSLNVPVLCGQMEKLMTQTEETPGEQVMTSRT